MSQPPFQQGVALAKKSPHESGPQYHANWVALFFLLKLRDAARFNPGVDLFFVLKRHPDIDDWLNDRIWLR